MKKRLTNKTLKFWHERSNRFNMKKSLVSLGIVSISVFSFAQSTLHINIKTCQSKDHYSYLNEFNIYRNDTLFKTVNPRHNNKQSFEGLAYGKYRIEYKSTFNKSESVEVELLEKKEYKVDLCIDYFNYELETYTPFIDQIQNGEQYSIHVSSRGCFHHFEDLIVIKRMENKYQLNHKGDKRILNQEEIETIRHFEMELNYKESQGCTTVEEYNLTYKKKKVKISDGSCSWNGYFNLRLKLNLVNERNE